MQTPNDKAVAKADERAETAAKRNGELSEEREKAFEALRLENEKLRQTLASVMKQVEAALPLPPTARTGTPPTAAADAEKQAVQAVVQDTAAMQEAMAAALQEAASTLPQLADGEVSQPAAEAEAAADAEAGLAAAAAAEGAEPRFVPLDERLAHLQERIRQADEAKDFEECARLTEKLRQLEARELWGEGRLPALPEDRAPPGRPVAPRAQTAATDAGAPPQQLASRRSQDRGLLELFPITNGRRSSRARRRRTRRRRCRRRRPRGKRKRRRGGSTCRPRPRPRRRRRARSVARRAAVAARRAAACRRAVARRRAA